MIMELQEFKFDAQEGLEFVDLSRDASVTAFLHQKVTELDGGEITFLALVAEAVFHRYPSPSSWPDKKPWHTFSEAIVQLRELTTQEVIDAGHVDDLDSFPVCSTARNILVKNAPAPLKGLIMTLLMNAVGNELGAVVELIRGLQDTGAEATLLHENPSKFKGENFTVQGIGGKEIPTKAVCVNLQIGQLPPTDYKVLITLVTIMYEGEQQWKNVPVDKCYFH